MVQCSARALQRSGLALGLLTNVFGGLVYIYAIYTTALQDALFLTNSQITVIGTVAHFGLAIISYPSSLIYRNRCFGRCSERRADLITNIITTVLQVVASVALALLVVSYCAESTDPQLRRTCADDHPVFGVVLLLYLLFGVGVGVGFAHAVWVNGANFHYNLKQKSAVVSAVSFAIGVGSMLLVVVYHFLEDAIGVDQIFRLLFWFQAVVYFLIGVGRCTVMYRIDTTDIENAAAAAATADSADSSLASAAAAADADAARGNSSPGDAQRGWREGMTAHTIKATTTATATTTTLPSSNGFDHPLLSPSQRNIGAGGKYARGGGGGGESEMSSMDSSMDRVDDADGVTGSDSSGGGVATKRRSPCLLWCRSSLTHLTFWAVFFGIGLGGTYQSMFGFLSAQYATSDSDASSKTFTVLVVFLGFQVLARLICVVVYRYCRIQSILLVVWELCELVA